MTNAEWFAMQYAERGSQNVRAHHLWKDDTELWVAGIREAPDSWTMMLFEPGGTERQILDQNVSDEQLDIGWNLLKKKENKL